MTSVAFQKITRAFLMVQCSFPSALKSAWTQEEIKWAHNKLNSPPVRREDWYRMTEWWMYKSITTIASSVEQWWAITCIFMSVDIKILCSRHTFPFSMWDCSSQGIYCFICKINTSMIVTSTMTSMGIPVPLMLFYCWNTMFPASSLFIYFLFLPQQLPTCPVIIFGFYEEHNHHIPNHLTHVRFKKWLS